MSFTITRTEAQPTPNRGRRLIGRDTVDPLGTLGVRTGTATLKDIQDAARIVYKEYPEVLAVLGL